MRILTVDVGNSRVKADVWEDSRHILGEISKEADIDRLAELCRHYNTDGVVVESVRNDSRKIAGDLKLGYDCQVIDFSKELEKYREEIEYTGTIGADRIAAWLGACEIAPKEGLLIVDAGTAMTIDVCDTDGKFRGGTISLGLGKRLSALAGAAVLLPEVEAGECADWIGHDTKSAIQSGAANGVIGEIAFAFEKAKKEYDVKKIVLTGGDSEWIGHRLTESGIGPVMMDPWLVGRGLYRHFLNRCV